MGREGTCGNPASPRLSSADQCSPAPKCGLGVPRPLAVDADVAFVVDSSVGMGTDLYRTALTLVDTMLDNLEVAAQPSVSPRGAPTAP